MRLVISVVLGLAPLCASAVAQKAGEATFPPKQIEAGAEIYATNCATCHGNRMKNPPWAIDLATVPKNDHRRFVESVTNGRNNMPVPLPQHVGRLVDKTETRRNAVVLSARSMASQIGSTS